MYLLSQRRTKQSKVCKHEIVKYKKNHHCLLYLLSLPLLIFNWPKFHFIHTPTATCLYRRSLYDPTTLRILSIVSKTCWWFFMNYIVSGLIFVFLLVLPGPCAQSSAGCLRCRGPHICYWWYWFYNKRSNRLFSPKNALNFL